MDQQPNSKDVTHRTKSRRSAHREPEPKSPKTESEGSAYDRAIHAAGGEKYLAATKVIESLPRAVRPNSKVTTKVNAAVRGAEEAALRQHAITEELLHDGAHFELQWKAQGEMGGAENDIIYDELTGLVWKRNRIDVMHLSWRQFFERMLAHNLYFPEAPLRLEGFVESEAGLCPLFTQPDVHAVSGAIRSVVEPFMRERGYARKGFDDYHSELLAVEDLHEGNVLIDEDGCLHVIDPVIFAKDRIISA
jgi:hypothetical protein